MVDPVLGGGRGGETGYGKSPTVPAQNSDPRFRRGAGGAGGIFGPDASATTPASLSAIGLVALPGADGSPDALGALLGLVPIGGTVGSSPFQDGDPTNDFWGVALDQTGSMILGEISRLRAGAGGGAGGDSVRSAVFPHPAFAPNTDDKGGPGGGGGGALHLRSRGRVRLFNGATGVHGSILANGGDGARGQLIQYQGNFFTKCGPGGGGGSGGHVVIETLTSIDFGSGQEAIQARGGAGGPATQGLGVAAREAKGISLFVVPADAEGLSREALVLYDATKRVSALTLDRVRVTEADRLGAPGEAWDAVAAAHRRHAVGFAAETAGSAQGALTMAVEYAKVREQFGSPIGRFQGVKHRCAEMYVDVESARSLTYYAAWAVDHAPDEAPTYASMALARAAEAADTAGEECIQIHGAIGFTWECDAHLYYKRGRYSRIAFGAPDEHYEQVLTNRLANGDR